MLCGLESLVAKSGGYSLAVVCGLLIPVASLVGKRRLQGMRASAVVVSRRSNSAAALCSMWNLCGPGTTPVSPALPSEFFTTNPTGQPQIAKFRPL